MNYNDRFTFLQLEMSEIIIRHIGVFFKNKKSCPSANFSLDSK